MTKLTAAVAFLVRSVPNAPANLRERNAIQRELLLNLARIVPEVPMVEACSELGEVFAERFPN